MSGAARAIRLPEDIATHLMGNHAILAGVPRERIVGAYPISANGDKFARGPLFPNPNYKLGR